MGTLLSHLSEYRWYANAPFENRCMHIFSSKYGTSIVGNIVSLSQCNLGKLHSHNKQSSEPQH